jgi:hypothetical protein
MWMLVRRIRICGADGTEWKRDGRLSLLVDRSDLHAFV